MAKNIFDQIQPDPTKGFQWYTQQVRKLKNVRSGTERLITSGQTLTNKIRPGFMYLYQYDPKHKDTLPYYDTTPLVLPYKLLPDGFMGLNLHYMPYLMRFKVLGKLHEYAMNTNNDITTRVRLSWGLLSGVAQLKPLAACVKHYLTDHVTTRFLLIPYPDWVVASQLPIESFVGATKTRVWNDTKAKI